MFSKMRRKWGNGHQGQGLLSYRLGCLDSRPLPKPSIYNTALFNPVRSAERLREGRCTKGEMCTFAHSQEEIGTPVPEGEESHEILGEAIFLSCILLPSKGTCFGGVGS